MLVVLFATIDIPNPFSMALLTILYTRSEHSTFRWETQLKRSAKRKAARQSVQQLKKAAKKAGIFTDVHL